MAYCTAAQVKTQRDIRDDDNDTLIATLIPQAQQIIDAQCQRTFEAADDSTRYFDSRAIRGQMLYLDDDLCSITSVTNGDLSQTTITDYVTRPRNDTPYYALKMKDTATEHWEAVNDYEITIVGKWAYSTTAPDDIVRACIRLVAWMLQQRMSGSEPDKITFSESGFPLLPGSIPRDVLAMLTPYRRRT